MLDLELTSHDVWQTFYTPATIAALLTENGFRLLRAQDGLTGKAYTDEAMALGVICQKV